jgi:hypothetical protein
VLATFISPGLPHFLLSHLSISFVPPQFRRISSLADAFVSTVEKIRSPTQQRYSSLATDDDEVDLESDFDVCDEKEEGEGGIKMMLKM